MNPLPLVRFFDLIEQAHPKLKLNRSLTRACGDLLSRASEGGMLKIFIEITPL